MRDLWWHVIFLVGLLIAYLLLPHDSVSGLSLGVALLSALAADLFHRLLNQYVERLHGRRSKSHHRKHKRNASNQSSWGVAGESADSGSGRSTAGPEQLRGEDALNLVWNVLYRAFSRSRLPAEWQDSLNLQLRNMVTRLPSVLRVLLSAQASSPGGVGAGLRGLADDLNGSEIDSDSHRIEILQMDFGTIAPRVGNVSVRRQVSSSGQVVPHTLVMELDVDYHGNAYCELAIHTRVAGTFKMRIADIVFRGTLRWEWEAHPIVPFTRNLSICFLHSPDLDFSVTLAGIDLVDVPFLGDRIKSDILALRQRMVYPNVLKLLEDTSEVSRLRDLLDEYFPRSTSYADLQQMPQGNARSYSPAHTGTVLRATSSSSQANTPATWRPLSSLRRRLDTAVVQGFAFLNERRERSDGGAGSVSAARETIRVILRALTEILQSSVKLDVEPDVFRRAFQVLLQLACPETYDVFLERSVFEFLALDVAEKCTWADSLLIKLFQAQEPSVQARLCVLFDELECRHIVFEVRDRSTESSTRSMVSDYG